MSIQRELPLALVKCCTTYVVSMLHPVPLCRICDEIPTYQGDTDWALTFEDWFLEL